MKGKAVEKEFALKVFKGLQNGNDVRGSAIATDTEARTITSDLVQFIATAFGCFLSEKYGKAESELKIGIGHDSRITAEVFKKAAAKGLSKGQVFDCGLITTPAMFQSVLLPESGFDASIMLTASHLPFNRNGMKFFISRSLSTTILTATDCTLPADKPRLTFFHNMGDNS